MFVPRILSLIALSFILTIAGCGRSGPSEPVSPAPDSIAGNSSAVSGGASRQLFGIWSVTISADRQSADVVPLRTVDMHLNVARVLETGLCKTCLQVKNISLSATRELDVDLWVYHPFPASLAKFDGFDVRGILISESNYTFPTSGRAMVWGGSLLRMLNPDGFTSLFNPTDFPESSSEPAMFKYVTGKFSIGDNLTTTLNPFVAYGRESERRMFSAGGSESRTVRLYAPAGSLHFGYAVDASWAMPQLPVTDPLADFPPEANCLEAYKVGVWPDGKLDSAAGATVPVNVDIFDHQGNDTMSAVVMEAPDLFDGEIPLTFYKNTGPDSALYGGTIPNEKGAGAGQYPLLVRVSDDASDANLGQIDAWNVCRVDVGPLGGWARTWGAGDKDEARGVALDKFENAFVTGYFNGTVDFDTGFDKAEYSSSGGEDAFLAKYDSSGNLLWARGWGGTGSDRGEDIAVDGLGNAYVAGGFSGTVDFDPGAGADNHTAIGAKNLFLCKFDPDGNFLWASTWAADGSEYANSQYITKPCSLDVDSTGHSYVTGSFTGTVDFDPSDQVDSRTSNGQHDAFLSRFDATGNLIWVKAWGGNDTDPSSDAGDRGHGVSGDAAGAVWVTGSFRGTVDFNPGAGVLNGTSNGSDDVFVIEFSPIGGFKWVTTWGGPGCDLGLGIDADDSSNAFVTGLFSGMVDFDPGTSYENHASNGDVDIFLSKLDPDGAFLWARTWGGVETVHPIESDWGEGVAVDQSGNVYVAGEFTGTGGQVDFDPGSGTDKHGTNGSNDAFLSKFDTAGSFLWARNWGGTYDGSDRDELAYNVVVSAAGDAYVAGRFVGSADFDPGAGTDYHSSAGSADAFLIKFLSSGSW